MLLAQSRSYDEIVLVNVIVRNYLFTLCYDQLVVTLYKATGFAVELFKSRYVSFHLSLRYSRYLVCPQLAWEEAFRGTFRQLRTRQFHLDEVHGDEELGQTERTVFVKVS